VILTCPLNDVVKPDPQCPAVDPRLHHSLLRPNSRCSSLRAIGMLDPEASLWQAGTKEHDSPGGFDPQLIEKCQKKFTAEFPHALIVACNILIITCQYTTLPYTTPHSTYMLSGPVCPQSSCHSQKAFSNIPSQLQETPTHAIK
jgi:hypothetical protein